MLWYSVYDLSEEEPRVVGVILESEEGGIAAAAIEGEPDSDSPLSVLQTLCRGSVRYVVPDGSVRRRVDVLPGDPGYVAAMLHELRPPLAPGPRGRILRLGPPHEMARRVWDQVRPEAPLPSLVNLG